MTLDDIVALVVNDVPGAPFMTIRDHIKYAAREFLTESDAWVSEETTVVVAANTEYAQISAPEGEPLRLVYLMMNGTEVTQGGHYTQLSPTSIRFPVTRTETTMTGRLALRPAFGKMPPQEVTDRWGEAFADGARYRLLRMPEQWQDLNMANHYRQRFDAAISHAKQVSRFGHGRGGGRVKARRFI